MEQPDIKKLIERRKEIVRIWRREMTLSDLTSKEKLYLEKLLVDHYKIYEDIIKFKDNCA